VLALRLYGPRDLRLESVEEPRRPREWVLLESVAVGICGTDKAFYLGTYPLLKRPIVLGHEVCARVVDAPRGFEELVEHLVVPEINFSCMKCPVCRAGLYTHCPNKRTLGIDLDGGLQQLFVAPPTALHTVDGLDPVEATAVEPLAAVLNAFRQSPPEPGSMVAVLGTGNLAILAMQVLKLFPVRVVCVARRGSRKARVVESLGFRVVYLDEVREFIESETWCGLGFDYVFEATGSNEGLRIAIEIARPRATVYAKSTPGGVAELNATQAVVKELRIVCTRCGTFRDFELAIDLLRKRTVKPVITCVVHGLERGVEAFERALERDQVKVVVKIS